MATSSKTEHPHSNTSAHVTPPQIGQPVEPAPVTPSTTTQRRATSRNPEDPCACGHGRVMHPLYGGVCWADGCGCRQFTQPAAPLAGQPGATNGKPTRRDMCSNCWREHGHYGQPRCAGIAHCGCHDASPERAAEPACPEAAAGEAATIRVGHPGRLLSEGSCGVVIADPVLPFTTCTRPTGHLGSHQHIVLLVAAEPRHEPDVVIEHVRESRRLSYRDGRIDGFIRGFCSALVLGLGIAALVVWL